MPPRATSSISSYEPNARGKVTLGIAAGEAPFKGPPSNRAAKRHITHNPRGASRGSAPPHFGQTAVVDESGINNLLSSLVKKQIRPNLSPNERLGCLA